MKFLSLFLFTILFNNAFASSTIIPSGERNSAVAPIQNIEALKKPDSARSIETQSTASLDSDQELRRADAETQAVAPVEKNSKWPLSWSTRKNNAVAPNPQQAIAPSTANKANKQKTKKILTEQEAEDIELTRIAIQLKREANIPGPAVQALPWMKKKCMKPCY